MIDRYPGLRGLNNRHLYFALGCMVLTALILATMGRTWWCEAGDWDLWAGGVDSPHNSQHVGDPYTFTHILHGLGFYASLWIFSRRRLSGGSRFGITMFLESAWEILENTDPIIARFREDTVALGYFGDSIVNSLVDIVACAFGYFLAATLPLVGSILFFLFIEVLLIWWIKDSLLLNILMLLWPIEWIREWQMAVALWVAGPKPDFSKGVSPTPPSRK